MPRDILGEMVDSFIDFTNLMLLWYEKRNIYQIYQT